MATNNSPNMGLPVPVVSEQPGPEYAFNINDCMEVLDAHTHQPGDGVPITPSGLNINADLPLVGNNITQARTVRFNLQSSPITGSATSDVGCIYFAGVDLYANDGSGNSIRLTQSGGVAGSPGSISNLSAPASAAYVSLSEKFVFQSNTNVAASLDARNLILRTSAASSNGLTISPPGSIGSDYTVTMPAISSSTTCFLTMTSGGVFAATIPTSQGITGPMLASVNQVVSNQSSASFSTSSLTFVDVTNGTTASIVKNTRPLMVTLQASAAEVQSAVIATNSGGNTASCQLQFKRGSTPIATFNLSTTVGGTTSVTTAIPASSFSFKDESSSGTYTYTVSLKAGESGTTAQLTNAVLTVYEI